MISPEPYDILGLGCVAVDDLLYVPAYPAPETKVPVSCYERQCGGLTATALVAAARLGSACAYAGILGKDALSEFVLERLAAEAVDVRLVRRRPEARPIHSTIIVDESTQSRTILYQLDGVYGAQVDWPTEDWIRAARVLFVDHFGVEGMLRAAKLARAAGIPVVADLEREHGTEFPLLLAQINHLIISRAFAEHLSGLADPAAASARLWRGPGHVVIVTAGAAGCWYTAAEARPSIHQPAHAVTAVDTTGCGDVFHGAYASALARGLDLPERVRFASAAAALKATARGGQAGIPRRAEVETFLKGNPA